MRSLGMLVEALPDETVVYPGHMGNTTIGRERATNPFLAQLGVSRRIQAPRGTYDVLGEQALAREALEGHARDDPRARRLRADRDARVRGDRAVRARRRRVDRRRAEGDVHVRGRRVREHHAAPGGHRAGLPRLPRARHAQAAAAGEALVPRRASSAASARRRAASASSGRSACEAIGSDDPAVDAEAILLLAELLEARRRAGAAADLEPRHAAQPAALPRQAAGVPARARGASCPRTSSRGSTSTRCARSTPTTPARAR